MGGTRSGAHKAAAARLGISLQEYSGRLQRGEKWCLRCPGWHPLSAFGKDSSRGDGFASACRDSRNQAGRKGYIAKPRPQPGRRFVDARGGDKIQARRRVNFLVEAGLISSPNANPCNDCGHMGPGKRHEYDHFKGYAAEHHESVEAVCTTCHHAREKRRAG